MARAKTENSETKRLNFATPEEHAYDDDTKGARIQNAFVVAEKNSTGERTLVVRRPAVVYENGVTNGIGYQLEFSVFKTSDILNSSTPGVVQNVSNTAAIYCGTNPVINVGRVTNGVNSAIFNFGATNGLLVFTGAGIHMLYPDASAPYTSSTIIDLVTTNWFNLANILVPVPLTTYSAEPFKFFRTIENSGTGFLFRCVQTGTTTGVAPTWLTTLGAITTWGTAKFECCGYDVFALPHLQRNTAYTAGQFVYSTENTGGSGYPYQYLFMCTTSGTTGAVAPVWAGPPGPGPFPGPVTTDGTAQFVPYNSEDHWYYNLPIQLNHSPQPAIMDGMVFLPCYTNEYGMANKAMFIFNSDVNYPWSWNSSNYIPADQLPDQILGLGRQNNLLVVFGSDSVEFFRNAGNSPGSPLQRQDSYTIQFGCCDAGTIQTQESTMFWVAEHPSGGRTVWKADGVSPKKISTPYIEKAIGTDKYMSTKSFNSLYPAEKSQTCWQSNLLKYNGKTFYVIVPLYANTATYGPQPYLYPPIGISSRVAYLYDVDLDLWYEWTGTNSLAFATAVSIGNTVYAWDTDGDSGIWYTFKNTGYDDKVHPSTASVPVTVTLTTPVFTNGTNKRKFIDHLHIMQSLSPTTDNNLKIRWSDDNYTTWSNWITLDASTRCYLPRGGSFRRRAYQVQYTGTNAKWFEYIEADITNGVN